MMRFLLCFLTILLSFCPAVAEESPKKVSLILLWKPQAQFAGYYVALEKGIYRAHGLDVTIIEGGPEAPPELLLSQDKADFGVMWLSAALRQRSRGLELVNVCQIVQRSGFMLVARRASGIRLPADLSGKKVSLWERELRIQPEAFFRKYGLSVTVIPQSYTVNLFLAGGVDAVSAMWYNEYDTILNAGLDEDELTVFFFSDHGLNFPEDGIYCRRETFEKDPKAAREFAAASLEGWQYAFDHPEETLEIVLAAMKRAHVPANRGHQQWMLARMKDLIAPAGRRKGVLDPDEYALVCRELAAGDVIEEAPGYGEFCPAEEKR